MQPSVISPTGGWIGTVLFVLLAVGAIALFRVRVGRLIALLVKARREEMLAAFNISLPIIGDDPLALAWHRYTLRSYWASM